jgi:3-oxoacyl-[acyl-carrier protein] reductase
LDRLAGKTALITGGARGLGAAIARRFHEEGASIIINDLDLAAAEATAEPLGGFGLAADVSSSEQIRTMFATIAEAGMSVDVLVNNAGISGMEVEPEKRALRFARAKRQAEELARGEAVQSHLDVTLEITDSEWHKMIGVHLNGTFFCSRAALTAMHELGRGVIINMGSIMGTTGGAGAPHYCAAKAGILGLTRAHAREFASRNIRVNAIAPGWIDTDMTEPLGDLRQGLARMTPMGRFGDVDDIAWAAVYLASDEAKFMTGQVVSPNGGFVMSQ